MLDIGIQMMIVISLHPNFEEMLLELILLRQQLLNTTLP
jgi:hypothetical protein